MAEQSIGHLYRTKSDIGHTHDISEITGTMPSNVSVSSNSTDYIAEGRKFGMPSELTLPITSGVDAIGGKGISRAANSITLDARRATLVYDDAEGNTNKLNAADPISFIDNNTVALWKPNGDTICQNLAVGVSSIAVANDLTKTGTVTKVDGRDGGYGARGDGSTGYYTSANSIGFPVGAAEREMCAIYRHVESSASKAIAFYGTGTGTSFMGLSILNNYLYACAYGGSSDDMNTGYLLENGKLYFICVQYNGLAYKVYVNGLLIYTYAWSGTNTTSGVIRVGIAPALTSSWAYIGTIYSVEIRNKCRSAQQIAEMAAKLLFPVCYDKANATYPILKESDKALAYHEYKFDEESGTNIVDTAGTLSGVATGTTIVDSELGLGKARKFNGTSDKITCGNVAITSEHTLIFVGKIGNASGTLVPLISNRASATGNMLLVDSDNKLIFYGAGSQIKSNNVVSKDVVGFYGVVLSGGMATLYNNSKVNDGQASYVVNTTVNPLLIGYESANGVYLNGTNEYALIIPRALSQAEIAEIYDSLMIKKRKSLKSILPTNSLSLGYVETDSNGIASVNDSWWAYGRREDATDGNRKIMLDWQYAATSVTKSWTNSFVTNRIKVTPLFKPTINSDLIIPIDGQLYTANYYGSSISAITSQKISLITGSGSIILSPNNSGQYFTGYVGGYAEVLEDDDV